MSLGGNKPYNTRQLGDGLYLQSIALPIAANTVNTNAVDLRQVTPYPTPEKVIVNVSTTASAGSANSKNVNIILQDSADNSTFANIAEIARPLLRVTDSGGATPAGSSNVLLPPTVRRYVRAQATGEANGGNASDATLTLQVNF